MSKKYTKEIGISKLLAIGLKPKPDIKKIEYFLVPNRVHLGIKILGMLDFLKIKIERPIRKERKPGETPKIRPRRNNIKIIGQCIVCRKEVSNNTGFLRLTPRNKIIKIHNGECKNRADLLSDGGLTLVELGKNNG